MGKLSEADVSRDPIAQFHQWFEQAKEAGVQAPEAVSLATAELPSGRVSVRTVLLKELSRNGDFIIYSNWEHSRKAADLKTNPNVAISFFWKEMERCVRVEGKATRMSREESREYFQSRPRNSQIGAWASKQSQPVPSREVLEHAFSDSEEKHEGEEKLECPPYWGGIRIDPERIEFWQGRDSRVHDRLEFTKTNDGWKLQRLNP